MKQRALLASMALRPWSAFPSSMSSGESSFPSPSCGGPDRKKRRTDGARPRATTSATCRRYLWIFKMSHSSQGTSA
eukprot:jgi/Mesvir1/22414/Mv25712-RA.1